MPSAIDISTQAKAWAEENLRNKIVRFSRINKIDHLMKTRCLDVLRISSLETADLHELQAVEGMLKTLAIYA